MTLRLRLTLFIALVVAATVAAVSWFSYASTAGEARADIDAFLQERSRFADRIGDRAGDPIDTSQIPPEPAGEGPFGGFARYDTIVQLVMEDGTVVPLFGETVLPTDAEATAAALAGAAPIRDVTVDGVHYRMITSAGPAGTVVQTARDMTETDRLLASLRLRLWLMGAAGVMLAAVGARLVAGRALAPVGRLTDAAEHVAETGNLDAPLPEAGNDEVGRLAGAFNGMLSALEISRRQQRSLVDDAGHELRTPLTSLRTNLEVLARNPDMEAGVRAELMTDVSYEIEQLSNLVSEVVELAGDGEAAGEPAVEADLGEIVRTAAARAARRTGRTIEVSGTGGTAEVRPPRIARAVANLLDNATKWSPPDEPIEVVIDGGRIEVGDRGPGIPEADLDRVFDRFYRADAARTMPGSGLGLAIVEQIVLEHGGRVWAMPREGGGTSVGFEVPLVEVSS